MAFLEGSSVRAPHTWMRGSHDVRLRGRGDQEHDGGVEILASRMLLGRYSGYFRNLFNTMQVRDLVNPWVVGMNHFSRQAQLLVAMLPTFVAT